MKNLRLAALALAACAVSAPAFAQSSVTVFGVVDLAARSVKNDGTQYQLAGSGLTSSRIGFRGVEDLGGGLRAHFWLEGALDPDTGGTGQTWQRRSTIGLQGGFGEIRLGREKNHPFSDTGMGAVGRLQAANGILPAGGVNASYPRSSNAISYYTPGKGFFASAMVAAGEGSLGNKHLGGRVGYGDGPWFAVLSYGETQVTGGIDLERITAGLTYDLKFMKLFGMYSTTDVGAAEQENILVGVTVPPRLVSHDGRRRLDQQPRSQAVLVWRPVQPVASHGDLCQLRRHQQHQHQPDRGHRHRAGHGPRLQRLRVRSAPLVLRRSCRRPDQGRCVFGRSALVLFRQPPAVCRARGRWGIIAARCCCLP